MRVNSAGEDKRHVHQDIYAAELTVNLIEEVFDIRGV